MNKSHATGERKMFQLPGWLWPNSNILPQLYKQIWDAVKDDRGRPGSLQREVLVDTNKIFPLLLTSQLPVEILGYIWSLANQKYAGQLTEQELYIVLALVALAQASYPFNSLEVLYFIRVPPIPTLNTALLEPHLNQTKIHPSSTESSASQEKKVPQQSSKQNYAFPNNDHSFSDSHGVRGSARRGAALPESKPGGFSQEVKAQITGSSTDSGDEFSEFQSAPIASIPSIAILDTKQGSAIGSRLANHNLGVKKMNEKARKSNPYKLQHSNSQIRISYSNSNPALSDIHPEMFPKCTMKSQPKTVILKDTAIRNSEPLKTLEPSPRNFDANKPSDLEDFGNFVKAEPSPVKIPAPKMPESMEQDLMSLQPTEDKYSALRALVEEPVSLPVEASRINKPNIDLDLFDEPPEVDDFGDFVSAEQTKPASPKADSPNIDLFSEFEFGPFSDENYIIGKSEDPSLMQEISDAFNALGMDSGSDRRMLDEKFGMIFETDKVTPKEDAVSVNSIEMATGVPENLPRSASVPSLDLKCFLSSSQEEDHQDHAENMHQMIYTEWKQYMESCVLLLQVTANIFTSITSNTVLREVLSSAQGYNFLCNLAEVAAVCRRVNFSHKEMDINIMGFDDLLMDIDRIWAEMEPFYANIPIVTELPVWPLHQGDSLTCALCLTVITSSKVVHNENNYHVTCANLWLNCVSSNLPVLRYPAIHHSNVPSSTTSI